MTEIEKAISALTMCKELILFDPMTGETHEIWQENQDNQDLYNACTVALSALIAEVKALRMERDRVLQDVPHVCGKCKRYPDCLLEHPFFPVDALSDYAEKHTCDDWEYRGIKEGHNE